MSKLATNETIYSEKIAGDSRNYYWPVSFDVGDGGYLGIDQPQDDGEYQRVLLSPEQVAALKRFLSACERTQRPQ